MTVIPDTLPKPDDWRNYWLGPKPTGPAIFHSSEPGNGHPVWIASLGGDRGFLWNGTAFMYFDTPRHALQALQTADGPRKG